MTENVNGRVSKEKPGVGKIITNIMTNASAACYIGQNGLYQLNGKATKGTKKSNDSSNTQSNSYNKGYSTVQKKDL